MSYYIILYYIILYYIILYYIIYHVIMYHIILYYIISYISYHMIYIILYYIIYIISHDVYYIISYIISYHIILYYIILYYIILYYIQNVTDGPWIIHRKISRNEKTSNYDGVRKYVYMACNIVTEELTPIVVMSEEFFVERLWSVPNAEVKSWLS